MNNVLSGHRLDEHNSLKDEFRNLCHQMSALGASIGVRIVGYRDPSLPLFSKLSRSGQELILKELKIYIEVCQITKQAGHRLNESGKLLWYALRALGYMPPSDIFDYLEDEMLVEIHDLQLRQIFRNFKFYEFCSYSLEQLYCIPFTELYDRDEQSIGSLMALLDQLNQGKTSVLYCEGTKHDLVETQSIHKFEMNYELVHLWALKKKSGPMEGSLVFERCAFNKPPPAEVDDELLLRSYLEYLDPVEL